MGNSKDGNSLLGIFVKGVGKIVSLPFFNILGMTRVILNS